MVERLVGLEELGYSGSHGLDIVAPPAASGARHEVGDTFLPALDGAEATLRAALEHIAGALVERKRFTIAVHYRLTAADVVPDIDRILDRVREAYPTLRREAGRKVFELRPQVAWDKGAAVAWIVDALCLQDPLVLYIGDDLTDESVFTRIAPQGVGIVVAEDGRPTAAQFALRDPDEVARFLGRLVGAIDRNRPGDRD